MPWIRLMFCRCCLAAVFTGQVGAEEVTLAALQDNTLYEHPQGLLSNGSGTGFFVGRTGQASNSIRRGVIAFDVAGNLPAGASVTGVSLILFHAQGTFPDQDISLHRLLADWGEGDSVAGGSDGGGGGAPAEPDDATWIHTFYDGLFWTSSGGEYFPVQSAVATVGGAGAQFTWESPEMVADVQSWLDDAAGNFGWILIGNESAQGTAKRFSTREHPDAFTRPQLIVEYSAPDDSYSRGDCNGDGSFGLADAIYGLSVLFDPDTGPAPCEDACDVNDDGLLGLADMISALGNLFGSLPPPAGPHPDCGSDPTADALDCDVYGSCL